MNNPADTTLEEIDRLCRRLRMPYIRRHVADVVATAKAQRWDPAETVRVLLDEEAAGRDASTVEIRRRKAAFPAGKTFDSFDPARFSITAATQHALASLEWIGRHENLVVAGPSGTGKSHFCEATRPRRHQRQPHRHLVLRRTTRQPRRPPPHRRHHHQSTETSAPLRSRDR